MNEDMKKWDFVTDDATLLKANNRLHLFVNNLSKYTCQEDLFLKLISNKFNANPT